MTAPVTSNPKIMSGAPCVAGTRIPVSLLRAFTAIGHTPSSIAAEYPGLTAAQIEAALAWQPTSTKGDPRRPAIICRERGWTAGTRLVGSDRRGPTVIEITAVGEGQVLAKRIIDGCEGTWSLSDRDWQVVA